MEGLNSRFAQLFGSNVSINNHHVPLAGETYGGSTHDPEVAAGARVGGTRIAPLPTRALAAALLLLLRRRPWQAAVP